MVASWEELIGSEDISRGVLEAVEGVDAVHRYNILEIEPGDAVVTIRCYHLCLVGHSRCSGYGRSIEVPVHDGQIVDVGSGRVNVYLGSQMPCGYLTIFRRGTALPPLQ